MGSLLWCVDIQDYVQCPKYILPVQLEWQKLYIDLANGACMRELALMSANVSLGHTVYLYSNSII